MKHALLFFLLICTTANLYSQSVTRVEVYGQVRSSTDEIEAITVFNKSTNKGTITDFNGKFTIGVALNDVVEISALQFQTKTIIITKDVIDSKQLNIVLIEAVNTLDAVLLRSGLSGNLAVDVAEAKQRPNISINLGNIDAFQYYEDKAFDKAVVSNHLNSIMNKGMLYNGINLGEIFKLFVKPKKRKDVKLDFDKTKPQDITDLYSVNTISKKFDIPEHQVAAFLGFLEQEGMPESLLKPENEFQRIDYLLKQKEVFIKKLYNNN